MRRWQFVTVALLSACITSTLKTADTHVELAHEAFQRGDYDTAERQYATAAERAEGPGSDWVYNEVARGKAQIGIERLRARVGELRALTTPPAEAIKTVDEARAQLRTFGGDDKLDAELVTTIGLYAERWITEIVARAKAGEVFAAAHAVDALLSERDLPPSVIERATAIRTTAAATATQRATAAGASHPLAQRLHGAHAASLGGSDVGSADAMLGPYARGVDVAVTGADNCAFSSLKTSLAEPGQTRRAHVQIDISACSGGTNTSTSNQTATWEEQVFDGYESYTVPEQQCEAVCGSVLTGGETCSTNYNSKPPSLLCVKNTKTSCFDKCTTVMVTKQRPKYRPEERRAQRTVTTEVSTVSIAGTWTVTRDGKQQTGTISHDRRNEYASAPATGRAPPYVKGTRQTPDDLIQTSISYTRNDVKSALDRLFAEDVAAATTTAKAASAAGRIDDEEEAWVQAVLLGGTDVGPLATRYDLDRARVIALFGPQHYTPPAPSELPVATTFPTIAHRDTVLITKADRERFAAGLPTFGGGRYWLQFDAAYRSLPIVTSMSNEELGGDTAVLVGVTGATRVLARQKQRWGFQLADEAAMGIALGGRTGGPEVIDNVTASFAGTVSLHYALGAGWRQPGRGAVFGGVRGQYEAFLLGTSTGSYKMLPLFVRAELPLTIGTVSIEGTGASLLGGAHWGLSVHWVDLRRYVDDKMKYFQLRIENTTVDATSTDFGKSGMDGANMLEGVGLTSVHFMYGRGW